MQDALIFIDTNILLDFYRIRGDTGGLSLLDRIDKNHPHIITTYQVEMEYKKNRQRVILESLARIRTPDWSGLAAPAFLWHAQPARKLAKSKDEITKQLRKLKTRTAAILQKPWWNDGVYQVLQRLFKDRGPYNLSREKKIRYQIRRLARKRFGMGYPPRKDNDTSIADAVNWEWIVNCAKESGKNIIIVSRDTDYGSRYDDNTILNDWLSQEFKERISRRRKITLTDRLTHAFKMISVKVTKREEEDEKGLLDFDLDAFSARLRSLQEQVSVVKKELSSQLQPSVESFSQAVTSIAERYPDLAKSAPIESELEKSGQDK